MARTEGRADGPDADSSQARGDHSRRDVLRWGLGSAARAGAAAGLFWGAKARAQPGVQPVRQVSGDIDPSSLIPKLVRRITMGITESELALANSLGYHGYLEYQLDHLSIDDSACDARLAPLTTLGMQPYQLYALTSGQVVNELTEATILRAVYSKRQLFERMVEFWTDHFNIDITKEIDTYLKPVDDRDVIRANALGTFPALLTASAHSPAMLTYLDNQLSSKGKPNENYPRELLELHSLDVSGGYTQTDVAELARCLTGWTLYARVLTDPQSGTFKFDATKHDTGQKTVLGHTIPAGGGQSDGETMLQILATHPSTASFIARKLARWFIGEDVSQAVINAAAAAYTATGGDIKSMLRTILQPNVLADATPRYKRPFHLFVSGMRAQSANITSTSTLRSLLQSAGHRPFYWQTPDGYPDKLDYWVGFIIPRWNFGASMTNGNVSGVTVDNATFFSGLTTASQMAQRINQAMFAGEMPAAEQDRIRTYLLPDPPSTQRKKDAMGLAIGAPSFQWY